MLPDRFLKTFKRSLKRHQTGQAIIILALGFIILLGFVGIVTDVSLLYIRYAALRRAVDSAAVAAAGQLRTDRAETAPKLAAIQFLEFHGVNTSNVFVETCIDMPPFWSDPASPLHVDDDGNPLPADAPERERRKDLYDEVCDNQRKLVRVTAFIESPTVFMSLPPFNFETITLSAASVSETATLDVVIVLDVSESMLYETTYDDWDSELFRGDLAGNRWARYLPPRFDDWYSFYNVETTGTASRNELRRHFLQTYSENDFLAYQNGGAAVPFNTSGLDAPSVDLDFTPLVYYMDDSDNVVVLDHGSSINRELYNPPSETPNPGNVHQMRAECRVRIQPYSELQGVEDNIYNPSDFRDTAHLLGQWIDLTNGWNGDILSGTGWDDTNGGEVAAAYRMFKPAYNFYGCCNDPTTGATVDLNGDIELSGNTADWSTNDFDFSDLVCQPFKQARDATRTFLQNIDFARGDRVAFVTFDRAAYLIDPDGYSYGGDSDARVTTGGGRSHMIDDFEVAVEVLNRVIGVRAEPNFYYTDHNNGVAGFAGGLKPVDIWEGYSTGALTVDADTDGNGEVTEGEVAVIGQPFPNGLFAPDETSGYFDGVVGTLRNGYHVRDSCPFFNAALPGTNSIWTAIDQPGPLYDVMQPPLPTDGSWYSQYESFLGAPPNLYGAIFSYENWGACRGTNIGAGLREANNALVNPQTTRQEGAVWVIVLLGDGAAGATDPIPFDPDTVTVDEADPYQRDPAADYRPEDPADPDEATYGAYGFCPYGKIGEETGFAESIDLPYCSDESPGTRHACNTDVDGDVWQKTDDREIDNVLQQYIDGNEFSATDDACRNFYDADDYARDWADYVAMDRQQLSGEQLPVIFTIGFNLDYPEVPEAGETYCTANLQMCLGEELLRYIANVGDNNQYDPDEYPNTETSDSDRGDDYGNYYNAPDEARLGEVFDEIAGKLFTRIAG